MSYQILGSCFMCYFMTYMSVCLCHMCRGHLAVSFGFCSKFKMKTIPSARHFIEHLMAVMASHTGDVSVCPMLSQLSNFNYPDFQSGSKQANNNYNKLWKAKNNCDILWCLKLYNDHHSERFWVGSRAVLQTINKCASGIPKLVLYYAYFP